MYILNFEVAKLSLNIDVVTSFYCNDGDTFFPRTFSLYFSFCTLVGSFKLSSSVSRSNLWSWTGSGMNDYT